MILDNLKEYFSFSKSERNGAIVLVFVIVILFTATQIINGKKNNKPVNYSSFEKEIDRFQTMLVTKDTVIENNNQLYSGHFRFDPNFASDSVWKLAGLTEKQITNIRNYLAKAGHFKNKEDLRKIYSINNELYTKILPYININKETGNILEPKSNIEKNDKQNHNIEYFNFDPNTANIDEWKRLGLNTGQIEVIQKYLQKGGRFSKKENLKKIFVIDEKKYAELEPYILIEASNETVFNSQQAASSLIIELNSATHDELLKLNGIGNGFASGIIKYRNLLGGFLKKEQLLEVYNFNFELFQKLEPYVYVDSLNITKININMADIKILARHPYIKYIYAKEIVKFRERNGPYGKVDDILLNYIIPEADFEKVKEYLTFK
ncbi:MAG: helix-hairpin-helix domain-containing protein [Bacteroidia bacterium]|nr:helix-hairpin-helix domain-containing protein [Bacteroidia bacterium]